MFFASVLVLLHVGQIVAQRTSLFFNGFGCRLGRLSEPLQGWRGGEFPLATPAYKGIDASVNDWPYASICWCRASKSGRKGEKSWLHTN
jgi:hypothetical protein